MEYPVSFQLILGTLIWYSSTFLLNIAWFPKYLYSVSKSFGNPKISRKLHVFKIFLVIRKCHKMFYKKKRNYVLDCVMNHSVYYSYWTGCIYRVIVSILLIANCEIWQNIIFFCFHFRLKMVYSEPD